MHKENLQKEFPPISDEEIDEKTKRAISLFKKIVNEANNKNWRYVVLSGFAIDANLGYFSRNHKDVDFLIDRSNIQEVVSFLKKEGHLVSESDRYGKDLIKVDFVIHEGLIRFADCDIHVGFFDEIKNEVVLPMDGKEIRFSGNYDDILITKDFLDVKAKVLTLPQLIVERKGWEEKIGLMARIERNKEENKKVMRIIEILKNT